jgi:hypothetical protein
MESTQSSVLLRIVLRDLDRTLKDAEANDLRDRIYAACTKGPYISGPQVRRGRRAHAKTAPEPSKALAATRSAFPGLESGLLRPTETVGPVPHG